jgi:hypothetical protein
MPDDCSHDHPYELRCLECGWKRIVPEYRRAEVGLRHERTRHRRRLTVWSAPVMDLEHAAMKGRLR